MNRRHFLAGTLATLTGAAVWVPSAAWVFAPPAADLDPTGLGPRARALLARQLALWESGESFASAIDGMRRTNPEWDFMGRTFLALALLNVALREPARTDEMLAVVDRILADTLAAEAAHGPTHFLLPYAHAGSWRHQPTRTVFVDGELALVLGARRLVRDDGRWTSDHRSRVALVRERMGAGPVLCAESYPDECWTFCNAMALASLRMADAVDRPAHEGFAADWLATARASLRHEDTGMLVSSFTWDGQPMDGPEGSTIWLVAKCLQLVDPGFAADQYARARAQLGRKVLGFGWGVEWPRSWQGPTDIDSGPIVPIVNASAGSSGHALIAARAFDDRPFLEALLTSLDFAAFPIEEDGGLRYAAGNQVGDAVMLYALTQGPLWDRARAEVSA